MSPLLFIPLLLVWEPPPVDPYPELPPASALDRFVGVEDPDNQVQRHRDYHAWLVSQQRLGCGDLTRQLVQVLACQRCWECLVMARSYCGEDEAWERRVCLDALRQRLGWYSFEAGRMPEPLPWNVPRAPKPPEPATVRAIGANNS